MTYIDLVNNFWAIQAVRDDLEAKEIALYFHLLNVANRLNWPDAFEISVTKARANLGLGHQSTFQRSRERLESAGLIATENKPKSKKLLFRVAHSGKNSSRNATKGATPSKEETDRQRDREETVKKSESLNFDELISQIEKEFPKRADIRAIAEKLQGFGGDFNAFRLREWVKNEKKPRYRPKPEEKDPEGWEGFFTEKFGRLPDESFKVFAQKYPEEARDIRRICDKESDRKCDKECGTEGDK